MQEYVDNKLKEFEGEIVNFGTLFGQLVRLDPPMKVGTACHEMTCQWAVIECRTGQHAVLFDENNAYVQLEDDYSLTIMTEK